MDRRKMIRSAAALASAPLFVNNSFSLAPGPIPGTAVIPPVRRFGDGRDWFFDKRFGLFVHWGLYSIPAWHEQHQWRARVPRKQYVKLAEQWNPSKFDPDGWLDLMESVGMKYITITTKHHDGFCLWDTKFTKFNTMNTPYKKDIIGMLADACHRRNVPLCLYYSIADWNHPCYPNQGRHHELAGPEPGDTPDWEKYMEFLRNQVQELCTNYGKIHGFWWDMNVPLYKDPSVNAMIRKLQPDAVINNRGFDDGDFGTPERDFDNPDADSSSLARPTESCQSVGMESWGYRKNEDYYTIGHLERSIDKYLSRDANYLLNAGPTAEGIFPPESTAILKEIGKWYNRVSESWKDVIPAPELISGSDALITRRENVIYVHLSKNVTGRGFKLKPINVRPARATLLNTGQPVATALDMAPSDHLEQKAYLRLTDLPSDAMADSVMIIKLEFDRPIV